MLDQFWHYRCHFFCILPACGMSVNAASCEKLRLTVPPAFAIIRMLHYSSIAQWQSGRLLTDRFLVRVQVVEQQASYKNGAFSFVDNFASPLYNARQITHA